MTKDQVQQAEQDWLGGELISHMRQIALSARSLRLAEEMFDAADERHNRITADYALIKAELEARFFTVAEAIGAIEAAEAATALAAVPEPVVNLDA